MSEPGTPAKPVAAASELRRFASDALRAVGCAPSEAAEVADALVDADLRGLHSHGVLRLPVYTASVRAGGIVANATMRWLDERPASARLDAASGFGQVAMARAADRVVELASRQGCGFVAVVGSTHYGAGVRWVERLTAAGLIGLAVSNTGPVVAPFGSRTPLLGTNPLTIGIPTSGAPIVLDMATSEAAYGRIVAADLAGETIPDSWALDADGRPTTDPEAALAGALVAFGGHKGSGIATAAEALIGVVAGARFSHEITDIWIDPSSQMGTGHVLIGLRPLVSDELAVDRADRLVDVIGRSAPAAGHERVLLPGQREHEQRVAAQASGVELPSGVLPQLEDLAGRLGIASIVLARD